MISSTKFAAMPPILLILAILLFPHAQASENSVLISLDAVSKPFNEHALSYPSKTAETYMRGIELLTDNMDKAENRSDIQKQYPLFPTYQTQVLSIKTNSNVHALSQGNATDRANEGQKSIRAVVDINSPIVWMRGTDSLSLASDYGNGMGSFCQPSDYPRGSGVVHAADFVFPTSVSNIKFLYDGPNRMGDGSHGIFAVFGLSNNPCSLLRQLGYSNFSYCFAPNNSGSSAILLGSHFKLRKRLRHYDYQLAQLVRNNNFPDAYSVNLAGISVGEREVPVTSLPFQENGPLTMIIDSVTPVTLLPRELYESVKNEFLSQMNQLNQMNYGNNVTGQSLGLDLCFSNPRYWPKLAFKFSPYAMMKLWSENYVVKDYNTGLECLAILPSPDVSVMGTIMQTNHLMTFDLDRSTLSFRQANCGKLHVSSATRTTVIYGVAAMHYISAVAALFVAMLVIG